MFREGQGLDFDVLRLVDRSNGLCDDSAIGSETELLSLDSWARRFGRDVGRCDGCGKIFP